MLQYLLMFLLTIVGIFLILLVLIQRGRGGGLAGAFGGMGGQSAFGTKAGDLFTRITIGAAAIWILLCAASVKLLSSHTSLISADQGQRSTTEEVPGAAGGASDAKSPGATGKTETPAKSDGSPASGESKPDSAATNTASPPAEKPADSK